MAKTHILIIDDDESLGKVVSHQLKQMGYRVSVAHSGHAGLETFDQNVIDLVLLDLQMPDMHGMQVLDQIRKKDRDVPVIIITAYGTIENAVDACDKGADDYLTKPFAKEQLRFTIEKVLRLKHLEQDNIRLKSELAEKYQFGQIISKSESMREILSIAERAAHSDASVLITGESGTGKELLAKAIHLHSARHDKPFIAVNCPSIPDNLIESELFGHEKGAFTGAHQAKPGKFEIASGGTIFLDEIGDLKYEVQSKLLRVLQEHEIERVGGVATIPVDVRVISATNRIIGALVQDGQFRQDLYYRLNVIPVHIPPLRERQEDIPLLVEHFIKKYTSQLLQIDPDYMRALYLHDWPGNVRELENAVQRSVVLCQQNILTRDCLMLDSQPQNNDDHSLAATEKRAIVDALDTEKWNQTRAAERLKIPRHVLLYRMKKYDIAKD